MAAALDALMLLGWAWLMGGGPCCSGLIIGTGSKPALPALPALPSEFCVTTRLSRDDDKSVLFTF